MLSRLLVIVIGLAFLLPIAPALGRSATPTYEVWVLDQGTNQLLIYDGALAVGRGYRGTPEMLDLSPLGGTRPHMIAFTSDGSRAIIANVGNGFVYIFSAHDRRPIFVEDTGLQAHAAIPTPDGSQIVVANQNDKNLTEIVANGSGGYSIGRVLDLDPLQDLPRRRPHLPRANARRAFCLHHP
jgi:DNA-binding beta-propeller fold protein YncE